jgi:hypothetical protein
MGSRLKVVVVAAVQGGLLDKASTVQWVCSDARVGQRSKATGLFCL